MPQVDWETFVAIAKTGDQVVSFPTDTVPALACRPDRAELIFALKQRSLEKPLILMGATADDLWPYVKGSPEDFSVWERVAKTYWPGALTLVLPASQKVPPQLNPASTGTIGIRIPNFAIARQILSATGVLATTSANRSGQATLETFQAIAVEFPEVCILNPNAVPQFQPELDQAWLNLTGSGTASTVVLWSESRWQTLRQGHIIVNENF